MSLDLIPVIFSVILDLISVFDNSRSYSCGFSRKPHFVVATGGHRWGKFFYHRWLPVVHPWPPQNVSLPPRWPPVGLRWEVRWPPVGYPGLSARVLLFAKFHREKRNRHMLFVLLRSSMQNFLTYCEINLRNRWMVSVIRKSIFKTLSFP